MAPCRSFFKSNLQLIVQEFAQDMFERGGIDIREAFIDGTFVPATKGA